MDIFKGMIFCISLLIDSPVLIIDILLFIASKPSSFVLFDMSNSFNPKKGTLICFKFTFFVKLILVIVSQGSIMPFSISSEKSGRLLSIAMFSK